MPRNKEDMMELAESAHRILTKCYKHLIKAYPAGDFRADYQYKEFFEPIIRHCNLVIYGRRKYFKLVQETDTDVRWTKEDVFNRLIERVSVGIPQGSYEVQEAQEAARLYRTEPTRERRAELDLLNEVAWAIAKRDPRRYMGERGEVLDEETGRPHI